MIRLPPITTRTDTLCPTTTLFRSLAREERDRVDEVGQHPLDRRFPLGDDLVGAIEFEQPDGSESWRDVNVGRLAGESGPRDAVLNDAEGRDHYAEHGGVSRLAPDRKSTRLNSSH